ncbi:MAG: hypothetical protein JSU03_02065 [Bacteroidetes bacterium]|nr:hypothetical protein [Bacteroidota bacterium]MBS1756043.1 hypothetical protein [Bacteroidota bacterium]
MRKSKNIFSNWHTMRWIRLLMGITLIILAIQTHDITVAVIALFVSMTAISNKGCCNL